MTEFLITFRESIEAVIIIGIIRGCLERRGYQSFTRPLILAITGAIGGSVVFATILYTVSKYMTIVGLQDIFEGVVMIVTSLMLLQMIHRMYQGTYRVMGSNHNANQTGCVVCPLVPEQSRPRSSKTIKTILESLVQHKGSQQGLFGVCLLIFFAILREGVETVLMLFSAQSLAEGFSYRGFAIGLGFGCSVGYGIYGLGKKVPLRLFFAMTSFLLLFFSAGMMAYGVHEIEDFVVDNHYVTETSVIKARDIFAPVTSTQSIWYTYDTNTHNYVHILSDKGSIGLWLKTFFGWNSDPNILEPFLWLLVMGYGLWTMQRKQTVE